MYNCGLLLVLLDLSLDVVGSVSQVDIDRHLELGREFLSKGQLKDALSQYHAAVDGDSSNYLTYYKRGTVYLALSKAKFALLDLDKVLELKPDFTAARLERGKILLKQAQFDLAETDFSDVLAVEPNNEEAANSLNRIASIKQEMQLIDHFVKSGDHVLAIDRISQIIDLCPWAPHLRDLRAESRIALGDYRKAISDIRSTTILLSDNTQGLLKLSKLHYQLGEVEQSLDGMRKCLKLDPEHKECLQFYRKLKNVSKLLADAEKSEEARNYSECVNRAKQVLTLEPTVQDVRFIALQLLSKCYVGTDEPMEALKSCQAALKINRNPTILCDCAEAYLAAEEYDDAIRDYTDALEMDPNLQRAKEGLQKAQKRQKLSESRDYYKILGVSRTATKREIIKAYRKAAQKWHPDNFQEGVEKKRAENKFIDIAAAKEVLTDDEKRAKFDQGEDPLDPESGKYQHHRSNPFQEFHHFHGSPFQFKFHFN